jgi:hypothetical protein
MRVANLHGSPPSGSRANPRRGVGEYVEGQSSVMTRCSPVRTPRPSSNNSGSGYSRKHTRAAAAAALGGSRCTGAACVAFTVWRIDHAAPGSLEPTGRVSN